MGNESIELSFLSIFTLITFFIFLIVSKYSYKFKSGILLDEDFSKPQAFHYSAISRSGGIAGITSINIFLIIYYLIYSNFLLDYFLLSNLMFMIGFLDDVKININPSKRLVLMILFLLILIHFIPIKILNIDVPVLSSFLKNDIFATLFLLLCFLFVVNGANLIDGFNGLLAINLIIINIILTYINVQNANIDLSFFIIGQIVILLSFLLFNFPNAKIFLGDSGSYLFGSLTALNTIMTNNLNPNYSSFFFCILLFYIFFEVFFSFIRKVCQKKLPVYPDNKHLHMLIFEKFSNKFGREKGNYLTSVVINTAYSVLVVPSLLFAKNPIISRYWFFFLIIIYLFIYLRLYRLTKN